MKTAIETISLLRLLLAFVPVAVVIAFLFRWSLDGKGAIYATGRMLVQLLLIGYVLSFVFGTQNGWVVSGVLSAMLLIATWIALRHQTVRRSELYPHAFTAIVVGGVLTLALVTRGVLSTKPWYTPHVLIPLAGMIFANSMNAVSLAAERFFAEREGGKSYIDCRNASLHAALIPLINSLFAVGLVSLPGMMTGQILSGVDPLIAARYQIMVMTMIFGSAGISAIVFLSLLRNRPAIS